MQITLVREKETKSMVRFAEPHDQPVLGTIYVPKSTLARLGNPDAISVELSAATATAPLAAVA
jgi:hypothetical protein